MDMANVFCVNDIILNSTNNNRLKVFITVSLKLSLSFPAGAVAPSGIASSDASPIPPIAVKRKQL